MNTSLHPIVRVVTTYRLTCAFWSLIGTLSLCAQPSSSEVKTVGTGVSSNEVIVLPEFTTASQRDGSYMSSVSTSGTRTATPIVNLPHSIQVLTEDFFKDFQLYDLDDMVPFVGGMAPGDKNAGGGGGTRVRGFFVPYFRNGFYRRQAPDSSSIARVEIVKGPQSATYGRVSPGGVINFISKKPEAKPKTGLTYTFGSDDFQRWDGFATGPVVNDKLFYRVDAAYYDHRRPTDFWYNRTLNISGAITWKVTASTSITVEHEHTDRTMNDVATFSRWLDGAGFTQGSLYDIPDRAVAERLMAANTNGAYRRTERISDSTYLQLEHRFDNDFSLRLNTGYSPRKFERITPTTLAAWDTRVNLFPGTFANLNWVDETKGIWTGDRSMQFQTIDDLQYGAQLDLTKTWRGTLKQRSLLTFDIFEDETKQKTWTLSGVPLNNALAALGFATVAQQTEWKRPDPFNPGVSGYFPIPKFDPASWPMQDVTTFNLYRYYYGGLLSHSVEFLEGRMVFTGSLRQDWAKFGRQQLLSLDPDLRQSRGEKRQFSYSAGINYHIVPQKLVGYVRYGTSFDPAPQADANTGTLLGNRTGKGIDLGLKGSAFGDLFSYTLSAYRIEQENETTANPENPVGADPSLPALVAGAGTKGASTDLKLIFFCRFESHGSSGGFSS